jgi:uncharacterized protein YegL
VKLLSVLLILLLSVAAVFQPARLTAGGASQESESSRGLYVAGQGQIIPPDQIDIGSYISSVDYNYPDPSGEFGITLYSGHHQVSTAGQEEIIQIGIQGTRTPFEELPVLNVAFVFDSSGSMSQKDKIEWAKESFALLLRRLRPQDILAVVSFAEEARVLQPATRVEEIGNPQLLSTQVQQILAEGQSKLEAGLAAGYQQVEKNFRPEQVNRVIFISDGLGDPDDALALVQEYRKQGISLSTVTVGLNCDLDTMNRLSKKGAGSSRFIANREKMEEIFSSGLDRMAVPIAYDLSIELQLNRGVELVGTWGYEHEVQGNTIHYNLPALHHRDYETMLAQVRLPSRRFSGSQAIASVKVAFTKRNGAAAVMGTYSLELEYTNSTITAGGIADPTVLKAGTMLHTAQVLEAIGTLYYSKPQINQQQARLNRSAWRNTGVEQEQPLATTLSQEQGENNQTIRANQQRCLDLAEAIKKEIYNTHLRLDEEIFADELTILRKYIEILGNEMRLSATLIARLLADEEIHLTDGGDDIQIQLQDLIKELTFVLEERSGVRVAFAGFATGGEESTLQRQVEGLARTRLRELSNLQVLPEAAVERELEEMELSREDLLDNDVALKVARRLESDYLLVGRIMEMSASVVVFGKLLNRSSGSVESVAQTIVPKEN